MVQQDGEFTSHGYHGSLLGTFSSSGSDPLPIASQVTIRAKRSQDVLGTTDQQFANKPIAGFGNPQLGIPSPGLVLSGSEPQIGSHLATSSKPMGILEGQNKGQSCDRSYSSKLLKVLGRLIGLRISEPGTGGPGDVLCDVGQLGHALRLRGYASTIPDELMAQVFLARLFPATHFLGRIHHSHGVSDRKFCRRLDPAPQDIEVTRTSLWRIQTQLVLKERILRSLQNGRQYDISPDGKRFLMIKEAGETEETSAPTQLIVVENWFEELKRLVPTN